MKVVFLMLVMTTMGYGLKADFKTGKVIELHGEKAVKSFIQSNNVRAIYFYKRDLKNIKYFFTDYDDAAESLDSYGVTLGFLNCTEELSKDVHLCKMSGVENGIHSYRTGREMLFLQLDKLFDANSIISNILQLALLRDVPILRNEKEVGGFLGNLAGKKDTMFAYLTAVGSLEHLVFLEMAFEYKDKLQFAITTDWAATKHFGKLDRAIKEISTVWWMWTKDNSFISVRFRGEFSNCHMTKFVESLLKPKMYDIPGDGLDNPFSSYDLPVVRFYYHAASRDQVYQEANVLTRYHGGSVWILMINMDQDAAKEVYSYTGKLPAFSFQKSAKKKEEFLQADINTPSIMNFLSETLGLESVEKMEGDSEEEEQTEQVVDHEEENPVNIEEASRQDDPVVNAEGSSKNIKMPLDLVPALTDKTFPKFVEESTTAAVLLYFPYDAVSLANLRMFGEAADMMGKQTTLKIARVNCYDWTDVCQKENIIIYPTLRVYKKGEKAWDYKGPQDTRAMFSTLKLLEMSPPLYETDSEKLIQYLVGPGDSTLTGITNTTVVGLFRKEDKQEKEVFEQLADSSRDRIMFVYTDTADTSNIGEKFSTGVPAVIISKFDDPVQPHVTFDGKYTLQNLQDFVQDNKLPKLTVLTPLLFPEVRQKFSELLILFTDGSDSCRLSEDTVKGIVKTQQFDNVSFNLMQVPDDSSIGYRVLQEYTSQPDIHVPHLSYVKFQKGEVFNFDAGDMDITAVTNWLSSIVKGSVNPSTKLKEKEWTPMNKGFEFLKIMEWEKRNPLQAGFFPQGGEGRADIPDGELADDKEDVSGQSRLHPHHVVPGRAPHGDRGDHSKNEEKASVKQTEKETSNKDERHDHSEL